jgi:PAS domain-containing protein
MERQGMTISWAPVVVIDIAGSALTLLAAICCVIRSRQWHNKKPDDVFRHYIYLLTLAIGVFAISRSFGHLFKQLLLLNNLQGVWAQIAPYSGAVNSATFVIIFAFGIYFHRFQKVHLEIEGYRNNLERKIAARTAELEKANLTLENVLNNSLPICITSVDFDVLQANTAYYSIWPKRAGHTGHLKCYESRPGAHCHTANCPLEQIVAGKVEAVHEVTKKFKDVDREFILTAKPFRDSEGTLIGIVETFQDISERKKLKRRSLPSANGFLSPCEVSATE